MIRLRRILIGLAGLALVAFIGFNLFKTQIANAVFNTFVERQIGVDRTENMPDGLHVFLCGTGSPLPDATRAGPCIGVLAGEAAYVFDAGSGSVRNMGLMGFPAARLEGVFLTHLHSDHLDSLGELLLNAWVGGGRDEPLPVFGPVGTREVVTGFNLAYRVDGGFRTAHHGVEVANPEGRGGTAIEIETPADPNGSIVLVDEGDLKITAILVAHAPVSPAFGYRVDYKGRSISISGDTLYHRGFATGSDAVDIMFHEALDPEMVAKVGSVLAARGITTGAKVFSDIPDYHASPEDAARAAQEANAASLVYYHTIPPMPVKLLEVIFLDGVADAYDGPVTVGQDGMIFSLPAGSVRINKTKVF